MTKKDRTFRLNKLVRDKIVGFTIGRGGSVEAKKLVGKDFNEALVGKIIEEAIELKHAQLSVEEIADLQEIIDQLCKNLGITRKELVEVQLKKRDKNGGFENGDFIETATLPAENKWAKYYASDPKRFPEVTNE